MISASLRWSVSLITFAFSLHLPVHFHRGLPGFQFEIEQALDLQPEHPLPHGHRRHLACGWSF